MVDLKTLKGENSKLERENIDLKKEIVDLKTKILHLKEVLAADRPDQLALCTTPTPTHLPFIPGSIRTSLDVKRTPEARDEIQPPISPGSKNIVSELQGGGTIGESIHNSPKQVDFSRSNKRTQSPLGLSDKNLSQEPSATGSRPKKTKRRHIVTNELDHDVMEEQEANDTAPVSDALFTFI